MFGSEQGKRVAMRERALSLRLSLKRCHRAACHIAFGCCFARSAPIYYLSFVCRLSNLSIERAFAHNRHFIVTDLVAFVSFNSLIYNSSLP